MTAGDALRFAGRSVRDQYRIGLSLFVAAPLAVILVVAPEFTQHIAEIRIGMFDSRSAAHALANDPTRWAFGYVKLAGVALSLLACARAAWCLREGGRWYDLRTVVWPRLVGGSIAFLAIGSLAAPLAGRIDAAAAMMLNIAFSIVSIPFLFVALAGLFGDRTTAWHSLLRRCWPAVLLLILLFLTGFAAMQGIHLLDHLAAFGRPIALVWPLMTWDALVVGALAALTGTGFALSYALAKDLAAIAA